MVVLEIIGFSLVVMAFIAGLIACAVLPPFKQPSFEPPSPNRPSPGQTSLKQATPK